ncbi:DDB1- and CUL4-associated factor 6 [Auxenochlorella protothecoides]|uniref:DDB1-and CUL4-associated factor 6 n=1 Tax=Auxenochlorella protothecoides TaxID=3075 RepID=A0A087SGT1_AUXPR|nr:DDB1- and CUL4-associated factor 6 [Auxenochlorella protothecoides]KFM24935.1 DDB1- and CUL4-associated factor 6 [Auxenochlorella protothecoides]
MLLPALAAREVGTLRGPRLESKAVGDPGLALRLCDVADLNLEDRGGVGALAWNGPTADTLAVGHADGRLVLWQPEADTRSEIDTGHTGPMHGLSFLPDGTVLSAAGDGQVRMHSLRRGATRPFHLHSAAATCVLAVEAASFLSGSSDGTVRLTDTRVPPQPLREPDSPARGSCLVVDQRDQRLGRSRRSVAVASLAQDECRPWLLLTGGSDPAIRLYDMRMARPPAATAAPWVAAYVPSHLKAGLLGSARSAQRSPAGGSVTAVAFARGGADVLGAYAGDAAYGFHDHMGEASDQEVSPRRMYSRSYDLLGGSGLPEGSGMQHMSLSALCQLGGDTLICPSSLGAAFVWEYASGRLTNVLLQGEDSSMESGTARPGYPQLATGSQDSTAAHQRDLHSATKQLGLRLAAAADNAADAEGVPNPEAGEQAQSLLLAALGLTHRDGELQGRDGRTVRCNVM